MYIKCIHVTVACNITSLMYNITGILHLIKMEKNEAKYQNEAFDAISILTKKHFEVMQNIKYVKISLIFRCQNIP